MTDPDPAAQIATAMATMTDMLKPVLEATVGYRAQAEAAGFSPTQAEIMAGQFHSQMIKMIFTQTTPR